MVIYTSMIPDKEMRFRILPPDTKWHHAATSKTTFDWKHESQNLLCKLLSPQTSLGCSLIFERGNQGVTNTVRASGFWYQPPKRWTDRIDDITDVTSCDSSRKECTCTVNVTSLGIWSIHLQLTLMRVLSRFGGNSGNCYKNENVPVTKSWHSKSRIRVFQIQLKSMKWLA